MALSQTPLLGRDRPSKLAESNLLPGVERSKLALNSVSANRENISFYQVLTTS